MGKIEEIIKVLEDVPLDIYLVIWGRAEEEGSFNRKREGKPSPALWVIAGRNRNRNRISKMKSKLNF